MHGFNVPDVSIVLETERTILRPFRECDLDEYSEMIGDEEVYRWLGNRQRKSADQAREILRRFMRDFEERGHGVHAVISKQSGALIGQAGSNYLGQLDAVEYLYALDRKEWGKGYATEIGMRYLDHFTAKFPGKRLVAIVYPDNIRSKKVLEKIGFEYRCQKEIFETVLDYYELGALKTESKRPTS